MATTVFFLYLPSSLKMHLHRRWEFFCLIFLLGSHAMVSAQPVSSPTLDDFNKNINPSMTVIILVVLVALFFMGFFSLYIRHCSDASNSQLPTRGIVLNHGSRRGARRGIDQALIEKFPTLMYSEVKEHKIGKGALECAVCLSEFEDDETLRLIPKCDHVFHRDCIDPWLSTHVTCPVCRANLEEPTPPASDAPPEQSVAISNPEDQETESAAEPSLTRSLTRSLIASRLWFPRSHSTGHSLVRPGENTDRFTLRLPEEVRKRIIVRQMGRSMSLVALPRERSSRRGLIIGGTDGSGRGKPPRPPPRSGEPAGRSDRWVFGRNQSFLARASSFLARSSNKVGSNEPGTSDSVKPENSESGCLPV